MLVVGSWALAVVVPSALGLAAGDAFLLAPFAGLVAAALLVAAGSPLARATARGAWWLVIPAWGAAELALDPWVDWGPHDPHGPSMSFLTTIVRLLALGVLACPALARVQLPPVVSSPSIGGGLRIGAAATLTFSVLALGLRMTAPMAEVESAPMTVNAQGEAVDLGRGWHASQSDHGLDVEPPGGAPAQAWRACHITSSSLVRSWGRGRMWLRDEEGRVCAYDHDGSRVPLAAHEIGPTPRPLLSTALVLGAALATILALGFAHALRRRVSEVASGEDARRGPDGTLVLESGRIVSLEGRMDVVVLALSEPDATYRSEAVPRVMRWLPGNKALQTVRLATQIDALEALGLASALVLVPNAWVLSRFS